MTMQGSSLRSSLGLDLDYPLDEEEDVKRSAIKKPGQSRSAQNSSMIMKVSFREVHLREYGMVLGDNPAVSHGAPVQLDWEPQDEHDAVHIDNYEKARSLWRAKDRRGFLLNAHKRVKILFAAGYTIDEIAKSTMEMKELRHLRAESLKTQGMMTGAIMALLSGAAETTGQTVRAVTILPNALAHTGLVLMNGTSSAIVGAGTEMMGLTNKVVNGTALAAKRMTHTTTKGTGKVVAGTGKLMVKGTNNVVKGTTQMITGTSKMSMDLAKGTSKVGKNVVKETSKLPKAMVKGTGVLFSGTAGVMKTTTKRLSRMVSSGMDSSSHSHMDGSRDPMDESERSRASIFKMPKAKSKNGRQSFPISALSAPKPELLTRQRSLDSARGKIQQNTQKAELTDELLEMQDFLVQLEGMDKKKVQEIVVEEQNKKNRGTSMMSPASARLFSDRTPHSNNNNNDSISVSMHNDPQRWSTQSVESGM